MNKTGELLIQDFNNNLLAYLDPAECSVCYTDKELNGQNLMYITTDRTQYAAQFLVKNNRVMFFQHNKNKWQEYIISETTMYDEAIEVQLESSLYATFQNWIEFVDITGNTVINGMQKAFTAAMPTPQWSPGRSDITGSYYMQRTRTNLKAWIFDWVAKVGGELEEEITIVNNKVVRKVNILSSIGADLGKTLYDDRDLTDINIKDPSRTIYTAAFGYGKMLDINDTGESQPTTFKDIVWTVAGGDPVDKPLGQEWVALPDEYKQKFGYYDINNVLQHSMGSYKEEGVEVPSELLRRTYDFLIDNVSDKTEYSISAIDLFALTNESIELNLGDMIGIEVKQLNYKHFRLKTIRYKESLIDSSENDFELNNTTSTIADILVDNDSQISDLKDRVDGLIGGTLTGSVLNKWNEEINKDAAYFTFASPQDGLVVYNANTVTAATKATQLKGGSLRISNTKTSGQFNWTTVLTGDGIIATAIYTGILAGNMFDLDLDSGIVKMGTRNASGIIANPSLQLNADGSINMKIGGADLSTTITNINNTIGDLNTSVDNVVQEVEGIQVGATNLLENSGYRKDINGVNYRGTYVATLDTTNKYNGNNTLKIVTTSPGNIGTNDVFQYLSLKYERKLQLDENLIISFYVKGTVGTGYVRIGNSETENILIQFNITTDWKLIEIDFGKVTSLSVSPPVIMFIFNAAGTYYLNSIMLEYGTKHTTWSAAPQDMSNGLTVVEQDLVIAQNNIVSLQTGLNGIQADVGQITTTLTTLKSAGSNLLRNTALVDGANYWGLETPTGSQIERYKMSADEFKEMGPPTGLDTIFMIMSQSVDTSVVKSTYFYPPLAVRPRGKAGQEYILSCWYFIPSNGDIDNYVLFIVNQLGASDNNLKTDTYRFTDYTVNTWHYAEMKFTAVNGVVTLQPLFTVRNRQIVYFSSMYLGEGNVSTGWSPNESDINVEIKTTKTDLAQLHIETDNITQRVTKVEQQEIGVANVLKDSGTPIVTDGYLIKEYSVYDLKPNTTYTIVLNGFTSVATKKIGVWFNGGTVQGGYFPVTTTEKTMVIKVTTPETLIVQNIRFYNYPNTVEGTGTINWVAMYEGDVKPPLTWTAAPQELAKISFVEQKTTAEALTTTISSGLAGDASLQTTKFVMNKNGLSIYNGGLKIFNNYGSQVFGADTNGNLTLTGTINNFDTSNGNLRLKIADKSIQFYDESGVYVSSLDASYITNHPTERGIRFYTTKNGKYFSWSFENEATPGVTEVAMMYAKEALADGGWQKGLHVRDSMYVDNAGTLSASVWGNIILKADASIFLATKTTNASIMKVNDADGVQIYRNMNMNGNEISRIANAVAFTNPGPQDTFLKCSDRLHICTNAEMYINTLDNSGFQSVRAAAFVQGSTATIKKAIKQIDRNTEYDPYKILNETDFYSYYTKTALKKANTYNTQRKEGQEKFSIAKTVGAVIGENYQASDILKSADGETNSYYGIDVGTLASVAAAHTKQLKEDFDKTVLDLESKIKILQEQLNLIQSN